MKYLQLDENNNPVKELSDGNIEWDADHFCAAEALSEDERALFKVVEILETAAPEYDGKVSKLEAAGFELNQDSKWVRKFSIIPLTAEELTEQLNLLKKFNISAIEADVDMIRNQAIGTKATEYLRAETDAREFKANGYQGVAPKTVSVWAEVKQGWSNQDAADNIIATADAWRNAEDALREHRLREKENVRNANSRADIDIIMVRWAAFTSAMKTQLGL